MALATAVFCELCCKILCKCCQEEQVSKEEFSFLALGLNGAGKSTLLAKLCGEINEDIEPTKGFSVKDISLSTAILHVKEVGGSEKIRSYWHHYYKGSEGLIFVVDGSASADEICIAKSELEKTLSHNDMIDVPLLVLVSKMETKDAEELKKLSDELDMPRLCKSRSFIIDTYDLEDISRLKMLLEKFSSLIKQAQENANDRYVLDAKMFMEMQRFAMIDVSFELKEN
eukprot:gene9746-10743_t